MLQLCLTTDFIYLHLYQPPAAIKVPLKPKINQLARWQLGLGDNIYTLLNQSFDASDLVLRRLLELMDGTRNSSDLIKSLKEFLKSSGETFSHKELEDKLRNLEDSIHSNSNILHSVKIGPPITADFSQELSIEIFQGLTLNPVKKESQKNEIKFYVFNRS